MKKTITISSEIEMYIFMLQEQKKKIYSNYKELKEDLLKEFEIDVSENDIAKVYEPLIEEDALDMQFMLRNITC